jgi:hypothetical protein
MGFAPKCRVETPLPALKEGGGSLKPDQARKSHRDSALLTVAVPHPVEPTWAGPYNSPVRAARYP